MVSLEPIKELPNVLPKCNPFAFHIAYNFYRGDIVRICHWQIPARQRTLTSTNTHKNKPVHVLLMLLVPLIVH